MIYMTYRAACRRVGGEVRSHLNKDGSLQLVIDPDRDATPESRYEYYWIATPGDSTLILSARAAEDLVTVVNRCLAEKRRQDAEATGTPVTDGHGMEAVVPPTEVVPMLAIHREYAVIGGEG